MPSVQNDTTGFPIPTGKSNGVLTVGNTSSDIENVEVIGVASSGIKNSISYKLSDGRVVSGDSVRLTNPEIETAMIDARTKMSTSAANSYFYALQEAEENSSDLNLRMFKNQYNGLMEYAKAGGDQVVNARSTDGDIANAAGSMAEKLLNQGGDLYSEMTPDSMIRALYSGLEQRVEAAKLQEGRITPNDLPNSTSANIPDAPKSALTEPDPQGNINESTTSEGTGEGVGGAKQSIVTSEMQLKILEGQRVGSTNRVRGGHSPSINNTNLNYATETIKTYPDGTKQIKYVKQFEDGNISKIKTSTIFPDSWTESKIINSIREVGDSEPIGYRSRDGATIYRSTIDGVQIEVIKIRDTVMSGYPTGGGVTGLPAGFTRK